MSSNRRNQRREALRPAPNREEYEFEKDLQELEELENLDHDMVLLQEMMKFKISTTEQAVLKVYNETVELIAFKGVAMIRHVAEEKMRNEVRERVNQREQQGEREQVNLSQENVELRERMAHLKEPQEVRQQNVSQERKVNAHGSQTQQKVQKIYPQRQIAPQSAAQHVGLSGTKIFQKFYKYEPQLHKKLLGNKVLLEKVLSEMNISIDEATTMLLSLLLNMRSKPQGGRQQAFKEFYSSNLMSLIMTEKTERMFEWPFTQIVSMRLRENNMTEEKRIQRDERRRQHAREHRENQNGSQSSEDDGNGEVLPPDCLIF